MLEVNGRIRCREGLQGPILWEHRFEDRDVTSLATWSANGKWLALSAPEAGETIVLDAKGGTVSRRLPKLSSGGASFAGALVMTGDGHVLDLADGSVQEGVSSWRWWRAAGLVSLTT